jgi:hypothetical protein
VIQNQLYGVTPFTFDQVDTQNEGQLRGQYALPHGRWTIGGVIRYDMKENIVFDREIAITWRGETIQPHLSISTLNDQVSFGVNFPGFAP